MRNSFQICKKTQAEKICNGRSCYKAVELLLDYGYFPQGSSLWRAYEYDECGSLRALSLVFTRLRDKRNDLKSLAKANLPRRQFEALIPDEDKVPDANVQEILQHPRAEGYDAPMMDKLNTRYLYPSIYHLVKDPKHLDILLYLGFRDIDEPRYDGITPLMNTGLEDTT
jgi:hypothetical protein